MAPIVNSAGKLRYLSGGQFSFPMVVLAMTGAGWGVGGQHNHNLEAWFAYAAWSAASHTPPGSPPEAQMPGKMHRPIRSWHAH